MEYNDRIEALAQTRYPQVELLKQIKGVGTLIALTFLISTFDWRFLAEVCEYPSV